MGLVARLKPEVALKQAQAELTALASQQRLAQQELGRRGAAMTESLYGGLRSPLLLLQGGGRHRAAVRLRQRGRLVACARRHARTEIPVRTAIGAGRGRIVR